MDDLTIGGATNRPFGVQETLRVPEPRPAVAPAEKLDSGSSDGSGDSSGDSSGSGAAGEDTRSRGERILSQAFSGENVRLRIEIDKDTGSFVYLGVDKDTGEVVNSYPPEEILRRVKALQVARGITVDQRL